MTDNKKAYQKTYRETHKQYFHDYQIKYRKDNDIKYDYNTYKRASRSYYKIRNSVLGILGNKCIKCGFDDVRALQVDHIHGGGGNFKNKNGFRDTISVYKQILLLGSKAKKDYQILCANCNWIKRFENNEHHKKFINEKNASLTKSKQQNKAISK